MISPSRRTDHLDNRSDVFTDSSPKPLVSDTFLVRNSVKIVFRFSVALLASFYVRRLGHSIRGSTAESRHTFAES